MSEKVYHTLWRVMHMEPQPVIWFAEYTVEIDGHPQEVSASFIKAPLHTECRMVYTGGVREELGLVRPIDILHFFGLSERFNSIEWHHELIERPEEASEDDGQASGRNITTDADIAAISGVL